MSHTGHLSELDVLRSQVADLSRQLAERDRSAQDLREHSAMLRAIVEGTAMETGEEFFAALVRHLTTVLHIKYAVIGEVQGDHIKKIRTLAVSAGGVLVDNFDYELADTPCAAALTQTFACFNRDVQATFPAFQRLVDLGAESYCAVPIHTKGRAAIGLLVVMDTKPLEHSDTLQSLLGVFAPRVAAEFERKRAEQERAQALADLHNVIETIPDIVFALDTQGNVVKWNRRLGDVTGYSPEELLNRPALAFVPPEERVRTATAIERAFTEGYAELEGHLLTKESRTIPYHWTGALLKNSQGEPIGITGVGRDVSAKRRAEEERQKALTLLTDVINNTPDLIIIKDRDLRTVLCNNAFAQAVGKPSEDLLGHTDVENGLDPELVHGNLDKGIRGFEVDDREALSGRVVHNQADPAHVKGEVRIFDTYKMPLRSDTGEVTGILGVARDITENKRLDEALRATEERWQLAVRSSNDGIWDWDIQAGTVFFSPRWKEMRGFGEHEITNHVEEWQSRIHPDDLGRVFQRIDAYLAKQAPDFCEEYRTQRKDGSYMWILDRGLALWANDGTPIRMVGSESDITEHKQALLRLTEQESLLRAILDTEPECVNRLADDGTILQMNRAGLCFIESDSIEQVAGRSVYDLVAPEFLEQFHRMHEAVIQGASQRLEFQIVGLKGTRRWMETHAVPLRNPVDHRMEHLAITRDITEHKRAETELRESEERYRTLVDLSPNGVLVYSNGKKVYVNQAACRIMGAASPEQLLDNPTVHFSHPDDHESIHASIAQILATGEPVRRVERKYQRLDGAVIFVEVDAGRIMWNGAPAIQVVFADITDRKRAEKALRESEAFNISVLNSLSSQIVVLNSQGVIMAVNKPWLRFAEENGAPHLVESFVGMSYLNVCAQAPLFAHGEEAASAQAGILAVLAGTQNQFSLEYPCHSPDQQRWFRMRVTPLLDSQAGVVVAHENITQRKQAELALCEREEALARFKSTLDQTHDCVFIFAPDTLRFIYCNRGAVEQVGYSEAELFTMTPLDLKPEFTERNFREMLQPLQDGRMISRVFETIHRHKDGHDVAVEVSLQLVREQGQEGRFVSIVRDVTERKQVEETLRLSEERFRAVFENAAVGIAVGSYTTGTGIDQVNPVFAEMLGYTPEELYHRGLKGITFPDDISASKELLKQLVEGTRSHGTIEKRYIKKDGSLMWAQTTVSNIFDSHGRYLSSIALIQDITERKRVDEALRASEERYRDLYNETPTMYFTLAVDGTVRSVNRFGAGQLGYQVDELVGQSVLGLFHQDDKETVVAVLSECFANPEETRHWAFRKVRKDGSIVWGRETALVGQSSSGETVALVTCEDITERRQVEAALQASQEKLRQALQASNTGLWEWNTETNEVSFSREWKRQLGYEESDLVDAFTTWEALLHPDDHDRTIAFVQSYLANPLGEYQQEFRLRHKEGTYRWIEARASVVTEPDGRRVRLLGSHTDITERKRTEQEQVRLIEELTRSQQHFQSLFNWTPSAVGISTVAEGRFIDVNEGFSRLTGYTREEVIGHTTLELGLWADPSERESALWKIQEQGYLHNWEGVLRTKSGEIRSLIVSVHSIKLGLTPCLILLGHDITERKRMEDALRARERELQTALQERERISQDLHDGILQSLFAVGLALEVSKSRMSPSARKTFGASLNKAIDQLNLVMREIRNFIAGLGPDPIEGKDLSMVLQSMLTLLTENHPTRVRLAVEKRAVQAVSAEQSLHVFRVVQEAVSNCIRHGGAQEARVSLKMLKQGVRLSIRDNGRGFSQDTIKAGGYGLRNMADRARKINGRFTVLSKENEGTRIILDLPKEVPHFPR